MYSEITIEQFPTHIGGRMRKIAVDLVSARWFVLWAVAE